MATYGCHLANVVPGLPDGNGWLPFAGWGLYTCVMARVQKSVRRTRGVLGGRSKQVVRRVLDAAAVELAQRGYGAFSMEAVASRAAVNKTTVYRRWPTRVALVTALVEELSVPLRENPLPDTGTLEADLVEAFTRRFSARRNTAGRAWARLVAERHNPEVEAIIGQAVRERGGEWQGMVTRAMERGEIARGTDPQLFLHLVRAVVDAQPGRASRLDGAWLSMAVRTVVAGARAGSVVMGPRTSARR